MSKYALAPRLWIAIALSLPFAFASAADYPTRPIRVIVPFVAGGGTGLLGPFLLQRLQEQLGPQFVVGKRGGGRRGVGAPMFFQTPRASGPPRGPCNAIFIT